MIHVPVSWVSYSDDNPARGRWDQAFLERLFDGEEWRVPAGFTFETIPWTPDDGRGRVVVFPCGSYADHGTEQEAANSLRADLMKLPWAVLIATSDEADRFGWDKFGLPPHVKLWVQTPRPEHSYPEGTFFHPLGSPTSPKEWGGWHDKDIDLFFAGQINHVRREECLTALVALHESQPGLAIEIMPTEGFTLGLPLDKYKQRMRHAKMVPCPAGICSQASFRFYEALEAGAIPFIDAFRPDIGGAGYWEMLFDEMPVPTVLNWASLFDIEMGQYPMQAARMSAWWQQQKRRIAYRLDDDLREITLDSELSGLGGEPDGPHDEITVCVVTSPMPSHPSTTVIEETIASVQERLPGAEIHILIDGVREEQSDRADDYWEYARRLCALVNSDPAIVPFVHTSHHHQSAMFRHALNRIESPYVMFVEHDTPLVGDIAFENVLSVMERDEIASMRFHHDVMVHDSSAHLYLETEGTDEQPYLRTVQWSQRPHVARTDWYRDLMATYFGWDSRIMIEDVMHGVAQHLHTGSRTAVRKGWNKWKLAVWAPEANLKRSGHLDGRGDDPKYDMVVAYDAERPDGAPPEGTIQ